MDIASLLLSVVKILAILAWVYGVLWVLGRKPLWAKIVGIIAAWGIIQLGLTDFGGFQVMNDFDRGLLFQACAMTMVALGLNLIYGFNGQFSLGQWGFYGLGAYVSADITYRWMIGDASGLIVAGLGVVLGGIMILGVGRLLKRLRGMPVLSQFTLYLVGALLVGIIAVVVGNPLADLVSPAIGTPDAPGFLLSPAAQNALLLFAVLIGGAFAAEISFLFGLPVLTLGSDYFGIATLGFSIVVQTLLVNSDTILPFPEMKGGRGMIGIPKLTTWFWAFSFMLVIIIGIAGGIYAHYMGFLSPGTFSFIIGFNPLIIIVFGGLGSMTGTIAASFAWMFFLEGMLRVLLGQMGTEAPTWRFVLYPIVLLLLMLLRPTGLLGNREWGVLKRPIVPLRKSSSAETPPSAGDVPSVGGMQPAVK
jgi:branched-chain amino acid transport system permease protein